VLFQIAAGADSAISGSDGEIVRPEADDGRGNNFLQGGAFSLFFNRPTGILYAHLCFIARL